MKRVSSGPVDVMLAYGCVGPGCWLPCSEGIGRAPQPEQVVHVAAVVRARAPLVHRRHDFSHCVVGRAPGAIRDRQEVKHVPQCYRQPHVLLLKPSQVRGEQFDRDDLVADHEPELAAP